MDAKEAFRKALKFYPAEPLLDFELLRAAKAAYTETLAACNALYPTVYRTADLLTSLDNIGEVKKIIIENNEIASKVVGGDADDPRLDREIRSTINSMRGSNIWSVTVRLRRLMEGVCRLMHQFFEAELDAKVELLEAHWGIAKTSKLYGGGELEQAPFTGAQFLRTWYHLAELDGKIDAMYRKDRGLVFRYLCVAMLMPFVDTARMIRKSTEEVFEAVCAFPEPGSDQISPR